MQAVPPDQVADNAQSSSAKNRREIVFLFYPSISCPSTPLRCSFIYATSCLLDALDGYFARILNQGTRFGAVLDMVTDRCTTTCLLVFLATAMPR
ncbi:hypothetical protein E4T44_04347 [Aureobasidium sp. EXF-8845]|nr:hypothetical protein E4T44_04347 [Aureobasidium sp. EXF-8845]KAI4856124.1 hypothetical protein E4T45_02421 [Aureobasidium sp. EXF-8846]